MLTLGNVGGDLTVDTVAGDASWLNITASNVNESGLGTYQRLLIDRPWRWEIFLPLSV